MNDKGTAVETKCCSCGTTNRSLWVHLEDKVYCWNCGQVKIPRQAELKFGQTVYTVSYFSETRGSSRKHPMMYVIREAHYEVVECRVVSFDDREIYLHSIGFVKRSEVFVDEERAEKKLRQLEEEKKNDTSESEQLHAGGSELL